MSRKYNPSIVEGIFKSNHFRLGVLFWLFKKIFLILSALLAIFLYGHLTGDYTTAASMLLLAVLTLIIKETFS